MPTITVDRVIAADPASVALLFGGPALAMCPRVPPVRVRARRPHRLPASYVTTFSAEADGLPLTHGLVTLTRHGSSATRATVTLTYDASSAAQSAAPLRVLTARFLVNLAAAAEARADAA